MTFSPTSQQGRLPRRVALLVIPGCPNSATAAAVLRDALARAGHPMDFATVELDSPEEAQSWGFLGSPSFHVDGTDLMPVPGVPPAIACRTYVHPDGTRHGVPPVADLAELLEATLAR